jgi:hypothetical protein
LKKGLLIMMPPTMNMMPFTIAADVPIWLGCTTSAAMRWCPTTSRHRLAHYGLKHHETKTKSGFFPCRVGSRIVRAVYRSDIGPVSDLNGFADAKSLK